MGFGGGLYTEQDKVLPGAYYKYKSANSTVTTYADRGLAGLIVPSDWSDGDVLRLVVAELESDYKGAMVWPRDAQKAIGYDAYTPVPDVYTGEKDLAKFMPIFVREVFRHAKGCFVHPLLGADKAKATCDFGTATKYGERGNALSISIVKAEEKYTVSTLLAGELVHEQTVAKAADLEDNAWITFKKDANLTAQASVTLTGGTSGTPDLTDLATAVESLGNYGVNVITTPVEVSDTKLYDAVVEQNEKYGHWMQVVGAHSEQLVPYGGSEYVITPSLGDDNVNVELLFAWIAGAEAACALNGTLDNTTYDGELLSFLVNTQELKPPKQDVLEYGISAGYMMLHTVGTEWRVLNDDNTLIKYTLQKDEAYKRNQTIRVLHTVFKDWYAIFTNEFLGKAGTEDADLTNYKMRLVSNAKYYQGIRAIKNFESSDIEVVRGQQSDSYHVTFYLQPNHCVRKVYNEITVAPFNS